MNIKSSDITDPLLVVIEQLVSRCNVVSKPLRLNATNMADEHSTIHYDELEK